MLDISLKDLRDPSLSPEIRGRRVQGTLSPIYTFWAAYNRVSYSYTASYIYLILLYPIPSI